MNNLDKFHSILEFIEKLISDFHIIIISETWIKSHNVNFYNINGFKSIFSCRDDRIGGGIVMYVRNDINFEVIQTDESKFDFQFIQIKLNDFSYNHITAIYRPPNSNIDKFFETLEIIIPKKFNNIILGDINIALNKLSSIVTYYQNLLLGFGIVPTNTFETRSVSQNIVDHVLCGFNGVKKVLNATIFSDISDHNFITSSFSFNCKRITKTFEKRVIDYNRVHAEFREYLTVTNIDGLDPDYILKHIISKYEELISKYTRVIEKSATVKNSYCPWLTYDLWLLINKKSLILKKRKRKLSNAAINNFNIDYYNRQLHEVNKELKREKYLAKKKYFEKVFGGAPNQRELWKNINSLLGNTNKSVLNICIESGGILITDSNKIVVEFNNYFANVGEELANQINSGKNIFKFNTLNSINNTIFIKPTSPLEVFNMINDLENSKGGGPYLLDSLGLKSNIDLFSAILSNIFNKIFETGSYPNTLKLSKVIPVFKSGDKHKLSNYRPISTLSVIDKLLEKLLAARINSFLQTHNILYQFQYGFRKGLGTDVALVETVDMINGFIDDQFYVFALFLDLKKAFDTVNHDLLLNKLSCYGFRGISYALMQSYLSNRMQFVYINKKASNHSLVKYGVPQGSVLGPLLFLLFVNDMGKLTLKGKLRLFADDAALFYEVKNPNDGLLLIKHDLDILFDFFNENMLSLNLSKTKYMVFHSIGKPLPLLPSLTVANTNIEQVKSYRYLGMLFDSNLNWQSHIDNVCTKISPIIGFMRKASYFIPTKILRCIYFAHIHSRLTYGLIIYGNASKSRLKRLQVLQNRCVKGIYNLPILFSSNELYAVKAENILPIMALHFMQTVKYVYRIKNSSFSVCNLNLNSYHHRYDTRNKNNLKPCSILSEYGRKRICFLGPKLYNEVPVEYKNKNYVNFKRDVNNYLKTIVTKYIL